MKTSILGLALLTALSGTAKGQPITADFTTSQSGFSTSICIPGKPCQSININIQPSKINETKAKASAHKSMAKIKDPFFDVLPEFKLDIGDF